MCVLCTLRDSFRNFVASYKFSKFCMKLDWHHGIFDKIPASLRVWLYLRVITLWTNSWVGRNNLTFNDRRWYIKKVHQIVSIIIQNLNYIHIIGMRTFHLSCLSTEKVNVSIYMFIYLLHSTRISIHLKTWHTIL